MNNILSIDEVDIEQVITIKGQAILSLHTVCGMARVYLKETKSMYSQDLKDFIYTILGEEK